MFKTPPSPWQLVLLGPHRRQQAAIAATLSSMALYAISLVMQWVCVAIGIAETGPAAVLTGVTVAAQALI